MRFSVAPPGELHEYNSKVVGELIVLDSVVQCGAEHLLRCSDFEHIWLKMSNQKENRIVKIKIMTAG